MKSKKKLLLRRGSSAVALQIAMLAVMLSPTKAGRDRKLMQAQGTSAEDSKKLASLQVAGVSVSTVEIQAVKALAGAPGGEALSSDERINTASKAVSMGIDVTDGATAAAAVGLAKAKLEISKEALEVTKELLATGGVATKERITAVQALKAANVEVTTDTITAADTVLKSGGTVGADAIEAELNPAPDLFGTHLTDKDFTAEKGGATHSDSGKKERKKQIEEALKKIKVNPTKKEKEAYQEALDHKITLTAQEELTACVAAKANKITLKSQAELKAYIAAQTLLGKAPTKKEFGDYQAVAALITPNLPRDVDYNTYVAANPKPKDQAGLVALLTPPGPPPSLASVTAVGTIPATTTPATSSGGGVPATAVTAVASGTTTTSAATPATMTTTPTKSTTGPASSPVVTPSASPGTKPAIPAKPTGRFGGLKAFSSSVISGGSSLASSAGNFLKFGGGGTTTPTRKPAQPPVAVTNLPPSSQAVVSPSVSAASLSTSTTTIMSTGAIVTPSAGGGASNMPPPPPPPPPPPGAGPVSSVVKVNLSSGGGAPSQSTLAGVTLKPSSPNTTKPAGAPTVDLTAIQDKKQALKPTVTKDSSAANLVLDTKPANPVAIALEAKIPVGGKGTLQNIREIAGLGDKSADALFDRLGGEAAKDTSLKNPRTLTSNGFVGEATLGDAVQVLLAAKERTKGLQEVLARVQLRVKTLGEIPSLAGVGKNTLSNAWELVESKGLQHVLEPIKTVTPPVSTSTTDGKEFVYKKLIEAAREKEKKYEAVLSLAKTKGLQDVLDSAKTEGLQELVDLVNEKQFEDSNNPGQFLTHFSGHEVRLLIDPLDQAAQATYDFCMQSKSTPDLQKAKSDYAHAMTSNSVTPQLLESWRDALFNEIAAGTRFE